MANQRNSPPAEKSQGEDGQFRCDGCIEGAHQAGGNGAINALHDAQLGLEAIGFPDAVEHHHGVVDGIARQGQQSHGKEAAHLHIQQLPQPGKEPRHDHHIMDQGTKGQDGIEGEKRMAI